MYSQTHNDIKQFNNLFDSKQNTEKWVFAKKNNTNEIQFIASLLFLGYKELISSQDSHSCSFTPSCSEYAIKSIKKHGLLKGGVDAFDRLTRCNGLSPELYTVDLKTKLLYDPVD